MIPSIVFLGNCVRIPRTVMAVAAIESAEPVDPWKEFVRGRIKEIAATLKTAPECAETSCLRYLLAGYLAAAADSRGRI
jgi:hypothetical protein